MAYTLWMPSLTDLESEPTLAWLADKRIWTFSQTTHTLNMFWPPKEEPLSSKVCHAWSLYAAKNRTHGLVWAKDTRHPDPKSYHVYIPYGDVGYAYPTSCHPPAAMSWGAPMMCMKSAVRYPCCSTIPWNITPRSVQRVHGSTLELSWTFLNLALASQHCYEATLCCLFWPIRIRYANASVWYACMSVDVFIVWRFIGLWV